MTFVVLATDQLFAVKISIWWLSYNKCKDNAVQVYIQSKATGKGNLSFSSCSPRYSILVMVILSQFLALAVNINKDKFGLKNGCNIPNKGAYSLLNVKFTAYGQGLLECTAWHEFLISIHSTNYFYFCTVIMI